MNGRQFALIFLKLHQNLISNPPPAQLVMQLIRVRHEYAQTEIAEMGEDHVADTAILEACWTFLWNITGVSVWFPILIDLHIQTPFVSYSPNHR